MSSSRWEAGSIRLWLVRALRRVWPVRPTISRFLPSRSMAKSFTIRSETFLDEEDAGGVEEAEDLVMMARE